MSKEIYLLIDDVRGVDHVGEVDLIARTASEGRKALLACPVTHLYLDNDLGDKQDMEGYDILMWAIERGCVPANVCIVSANPVAKKRIEEALFHDMGYRFHSHGWWS